MAKQCPSCQQLLDETARFCPICGASVEGVRSLDAPIEVPEGQLPPPLLPEGSATETRSHDSTFHPPPLPGEPQSVLKPAFLGGVISSTMSEVDRPVAADLAWRRGNRQRLRHLGDPFHRHAGLLAGIPSGYNIALTLLSLVAAIVLTGIGLASPLSRTLPGASWLGGAIVGGGIAAMHYTGMAAFEIQGASSGIPCWSSSRSRLAR